MANMKGSHIREKADEVASLIRQLTSGELFLDLYFKCAVKLDWLNQSSLPLLRPVRIWVQQRCGVLATSVLVSGASA